MANFGTHFAWPEPPRPTDSGVFHAVLTERAARGASAAIGRAMRRTRAALVRAVAEAPLDLAWPPSGRSAVRRYDVLHRRD